jgi:hypothetical protein
MATQTPHGAMTDQNANSEAQIGLPLLETTMRHCRWPIGDPRGRNPRVCGAPIARPGLPYCPHHMLRGYGGSNEKVEIDKAPPSALNKNARESLAHYYTRSTVRLGTWLDPLTVEMEEVDQEPEEDEGNEQDDANNNQDDEDKPKKPRKKPAPKIRWSTKRLIAKTNENPFIGKRRQAFEIMVAAGPNGIRYNDWKAAVNSITEYPLITLREMLKHVEVADVE